MADTTNLDTNEKVDILIKQSFGFPSTSENKQWYEETTVKFNNYLNGEELFLDVIPNIPDFDICGTVRLPEDVGLASSDFMNFNSNSSDKSTCSIVDDSTGTVRRYRLLILEQTPQLGDDAGASWYKLNGSSNNVVKDAFQFNFKQYKDDDGNVVQPYLYGLYTQKSTSSVLPFGRTGGNWNFDIRSGIIFFPDFNNFSNGTQTDSKFQINVTDNYPVLTFYKYIGRKGINLLNTQLNDVSNILSQIIDGCYNIVGSSGGDASFVAFEASFNEYFDFGEALTIKKDVYISQNLYVDGSFTYINSSVQSIVDPIIELGADSCGNELLVNDGQDRGLKLTYYDDSYNIQKSGFIGLINQESSDLYNTFALFSDASFNNNIVDLSESILGLLNLYGLNSEVINTSSLYNNNDLSLGQISLLDNSNNLVLNLKQINDLIDSKSFLTEELFSNFIDNSYNLDLSTINLDLSLNKLDISNLYQLINDISNRSINIDLSNIDLSAINVDISNLAQEILFLKNQDLLLKSDINFNSALININKESINDNNNSINILNTLVNELVNSNILNDNNIKILNDKDNLLKSDINYLSSLINNNKIDVELLLSRVNDLENVDDEFKEDVSNILKIIPLLKDQDNLLKSDINYLSSLINNNKIDIDLLLSRVNDLEHVDDEFKEDITNILKIIPLLKDQDNLLKSDINYLSSIINNNKEEIKINKDSLEINRKNINVNTENISKIKNNLNNLENFDLLLKSDINYNSSLINNLNQDNLINKEIINLLKNDTISLTSKIDYLLKIILNLSNQNNLSKEDINFNNSLINYNNVKLTSLEDFVDIINNNLKIFNQKFSDLEKKLQNAFDFL